MEHGDLWPGTNLLMYLPAVITHVTIKDFLNLVLILAIDDSRGWRSGMSITWNRVGEC
jgi:hypothetical protein